MRLGGDVLALYLRGSAARGEWVPGLSDVDFYMVVKNEVFYDNAARTALRRRVESILEAHKPSWAVSSCKVVPESSIKNNPVGALLTGMDARLILGQDLLREAQKPTIEDLRSFGVNYALSLCNHWKLAPKTSLELAAWAQHMVLKLAQAALLTRGVVKLRKIEVVDDFLKYYGKYPLASVVEWAWETRSLWSRSINRPKVIALPQAFYSFPSILREYLPKSQQ
jgi:hypothetical protein